MAVRIRLTRVGRRKKPLWRIAVFDARTRRDGRYIEDLGIYHPDTESPVEKVKIDLKRYNYWVSQGALPTGTLERLLRHTGQLKGK